MPYVTSHNTEIYYDQYGAGERTLVFAHGMGGNAAIWFNQVAEFSKDYSVIVFDHRYFARSSCDESNFKPAFFPDDVMAIMDATNTQTATFVCQSMGGWTGSQMALQHPERVDALLMSHTPGVFFHPSAFNDPKRVAEQVTARPMTGFGSAALAADFPEKDPAGAVLYAQISSFNGIDPAVVPRQINASQLGVNTETLTDYDVPTLFVTADQDILFPPDFISALAKTIPGADCVNLGDAGHSSYFEKPEAFNQVLRDFLSATAG